MMPSRRDALKLGAAGLAGAAGLGAASQTADASTGSAGTIGSNSDKPDLLADQVDAREIIVDNDGDGNGALRGGDSVSSLGDDSATTIISQSIPTTVLSLTFLRGGSVDVSALIAVSTTIPRATVLAQGSSGSDTIEAVTSTNLTGTTGTNGVFTVAANNGEVQIENRLGQFVSDVQFTFN
jgi:hypothetical protein